jgi:hypothetical protein
MLEMSLLTIADAMTRVYKPASVSEIAVFLQHQADAGGQIGQQQCQQLQQHEQQHPQYAAARAHQRYFPRGVRYVKTP